jgi:hypothetical protein
MDLVDVLRLRHYSIRTEANYCDWIRRYIQFHKMSKREDLNEGEGKIELFLSDLAVNGKVAVSTHHASLDLKLEISDCRSGDAGGMGTCFTRIARIENSRKLKRDA